MRPIPLLAILFSILACTKEFVVEKTDEGLDFAQSDFLLKSPQTEFNGLACVVDQDMAIYFAKAFCPDKTICDIEVKTSDRDTLFYLINFNDGWIVISSDRRTEPILAYSQNDHMKLVQKDDVGWNIMNETISSYVLHTKQNETIKNDAVTRMWADIEYITHGKKRKLVRIAPKTKGYWLEGEYHDEPYWILEPVSWEVEPVSDVLSGHFVETKWGQEYPWNNWLPEIGGQSCPMGCVAVAVSQALVFFHSFLGEPYGLHHDISFSSNFHDGSDIILSDYHENSERWQYMPRDRSCSGIQYASDLMAEVGHCVNMRYSPYGSGADLLPGMLDCFNINFQRGSYGVARVINNLNNEEPVLVGGSFFLGIDPIDNVPVHRQHMWIIDGQRVQTFRTRTVHRWTLVTPGECDCVEEEIEIVEGDDYYLTYEEGLSRNPTSELYTYDYGAPYSYHHILMNWGDDGQGDDVEYSIYPTSAWEYCSHEFAPDFDVTLWSDFDTL